MKDPAVNTSGQTTSFIPVVYRQPNIITSRATGTFVYDTRNASIDPTKGRSLSVSLGVAGLGGDVRTYEPTLEFTQFIPIRKKRSQYPEVFGFRILAGTVGSFATSAKVRGANSLAFVEGVPIYERFFLGDEFTIRGYNVRSISPVTPLDSFITSRNVVLATNVSGTPNVIPGLPSNLLSISGRARIGASRGIAHPSTDLFSVPASPAPAFHWRTTTFAPPWKGRSPSSLPIVVASTL